MADEWSVLEYREIATVETYERIPEYVDKKVRGRAMHNLLNQCLEIDADFNTARVRESWNWLDQNRVICSHMWPNRTYREYTYQLMAEKGSRFLR